MQEHKQSPIDWPAVLSGIVAGLATEILLRLLEIVFQK